MVRVRARAMVRVRTRVRVRVRARPGVRARAMVRARPGVRARVCRLLNQALLFLLIARIVLLQSLPDLLTEHRNVERGLQIGFGLC